MCLHLYHVFCIAAACVTVSRVYICSVLRLHQSLARSLERLKAPGACWFGAFLLKVARRLRTIGRFVTSLERTPVWTECVGSACGPLLMQSEESRLQRNSAVERASAAGFDSNAPEARPVPQLPSQCGHCLRWVDRSRLAVTPVGSPPQCCICLSLDQVSSAVPTATLSREEEDEVLEMLFDLFALLRGRRWARPLGSQT